MLLVLSLAMRGAEIEEVEDQFLFAPSVGSFAPVCMGQSSPYQFFDGHQTFGVCLDGYQCFGMPMPLSPL